MPTLAVTIEDEDGRPCVTTARQMDRWRRHFNKVLNVQSQFDAAEIEQVRQRPCDNSLGKPPVKADIDIARI